MKAIFLHDDQLYIVQYSTVTFKCERRGILSADNPVKQAVNISKYNYKLGENDQL